MNRIRAVLFNGAPRAGKDTATKFLCDQLHARPTLNIVPLHRKMAAPLKNGAHALFGLDVEHDHFENCKDLPNAAFFGDTPRHVYKSLSEKWVKPQYGKDAFGKIFCAEAIAAAKEAIKGTAKDAMIMCSDIGFDSELNVVIKEFGEQNVLLFRLHRDGCGFENDTRSLINSEKICCIDVQNENKTKLMFDIFGNTLHWYDFGTTVKGAYA